MVLGIAIYRFVVGIFLLEIFTGTQINNSIEKKLLSEKIVQNKKHPNSAADEITAQWIQNPNFNSETGWYSNKTGDVNDTAANIFSGEANLKVIGNQGKFVELANPPNSTWTKVLNPDFPRYPDVAVINSSGCCVSHLWPEEADQSPSVHWEKNVTLPVNMSDYSITWANITSIFNATVRADGNPEDRGGIEVPGDYTYGGNQYATYDYARFYILISNPSKTKKYEIAYFQTTTLGADGANLDYDTLSNTYMNQVSTESLKFYLSDVLSEDNYNFTIDIGIRIWCEDNWWSDTDEFTRLCINFVNLTFDYEQKINQGSSINWNQNGESTPNNIQVTNATLFFKYKIDVLWPSVSPNAEFRILIDPVQLPSTIKLSDMKIDYQDAIIDVTNFIPQNTRINISLIVYLADNFNLNQNITISVDDVYLNITYKDTTPDVETELAIFLNDALLTADPTITVPIGRDLNLTVKYMNNSQYIPKATIELDVWGTKKNFTEYNTLQQYTLILNATGDTNSELKEGINVMDLTALKKGFVSLSDTIVVTVRKINTNITSLDGLNHNIIPGANDTLQIKVYDMDNNVTVKNQTVSWAYPYGNGLLADVDQDGIYNGTISNIPEGGPYPVIINVYGNNSYQYNQTQILLTSNSTLLTPTNYTILFNGIDYGIKDPIVSIPYGASLNITAKYTNQIGEFISNATVKISRVGFPEVILIQNETLQQYSIILDADTDFIPGENYLAFHTWKLGYTSNDSAPIVNLRKINATIWSLDGNYYAISPGEDVTFRVQANNSDYGDTVKGLSMTYSWSSGSGLLTDGLDADEDGIYNVTFPNFLTPGSHKFSITASHENFSVNLIELTVYCSSDNQISTDLTILVNGSNLGITPVFTLPLHSFVNITVIYVDEDTSHIPGANLLLNRGGYTDTLKEQPTFGQYSIIYDVDHNLTLGINNLQLSASKIKYDSKVTSIQINVRKINTTIISIDNEPFNIAPGEDFTLSVMLQNEDYGGLIKGMIVSYSWDFGSGFLTDLDNDGIYQATLEDIPEGSNSVTVSVIGTEEYAFNPKQFTINGQTSLLIQTKWSLIINGVNTTYSPNIEVPIGSKVNVTVIYTDTSNNFLPNATLQLTRGIFVFILEKDPILNQYSIIIDVDSMLLEGSNKMVLNARKLGYLSLTLESDITVRKIKTQISSESGSNQIEISPKQDVLLQIRLTNLDTLDTIKNVTVRYSYALGQGELKDENGDGVYEILLENFPEGTYKITITVYASDNYQFEIYEQTIIAARTPEEIRNQRIILFGTVGGIIALGGYLVMYQTKWKYPKSVRELRSMKKALLKNKSNLLNTKSRSGAFTEKYLDQVKDFISNERKLQLKESITPITPGMNNLTKSDIKSAEIDKLSKKSEKLDNIDREQTQEQEQEPAQEKVKEEAIEKEIPKKQLERGMDLTYNEPVPNNNLAKPTITRPWENTNISPDSKSMSKAPSPKTFDKKPQPKGLPQTKPLDADKQDKKDSSED